jgi:DNA ligase (NAD+)
MQSDQSRTYPFWVDGLVLKVNDLSLYRRLGVVGKTPRGAIAFKFSAEEATTIVEDIVVQVGRTGALTPVAQLRPVKVAGTTVSRATLHNADEVARKDVRVGDTVIVRKAGDIIPEVVRVLPQMRPPHTEAFAWPNKCPMCGSKVVQDQGGVIWRCVNKECFPRQRAHVLHAIGRSAFDIEGLGEKITEQLLQHGLIASVPDIWELTVDDLKTLEGFADKSANNVIKSIQSRKKIPLRRFILALGIPHVGAITAQDLARHFRTLTRFEKATSEQLHAISGIGPKVAEAVHEFFKNPANKKLLAQYKAAGIKIESEAMFGTLQGRSFVITGSMPNMTRAEAKQRIAERGGQVVSTVGKKTDYVVVGDEPGSKANKARELGITILSPKEFQELLKSG